MTAQNQRLTAPEVSGFVQGRVIYVYDPDTRRRVATVSYQPDGVVETHFDAGGSDTGAWGLEGDTYWTQYAAFRDGTRNGFYLVWVAHDTAQAYFTDDTRAFLQSGHAALPAAQG